MKTPLILRAAAFADHAHGSIGQIRKYTGEPYVRHPQAVAELVTRAGGDEAMICAAWLHDTVEDTPVTLAEVSAFGTEIGELVYWLTDVSRPEHGNRQVRKAMDREHIARAPARAQAVKLADLIHNSESILKHDPGFAVGYLKEKALLLEAMRPTVTACPAGAVLLPRAEAILRAGQEELLQRNLAARDGVTISGPLSVSSELEP